MNRPHQLPPEVIATVDEFLRDMTARGVGVFGLVYVLMPEPAMTLMQNRSADPVEQADSLLQIVRMDNVLRLANAGVLSDAVHLDTNGVVCFPGGYMHPKSFRQIVGEALYQELLKRPRVQGLYPEEQSK